MGATCVLKKAGMIGKMNAGFPSIITSGPGNLNERAKPAEPTDTADPARAVRTAPVEGNVRSAKSRSHCVERIAGSPGTTAFGRESAIPVSGTYTPRTKFGKG